MSKKYKILIFSTSVWKNENSFGNTFSNIFNDIPDIEIANIYIENDFPDNSLQISYFRMTDKEILKNLFNSSEKVGERVYPLKHTEKKTLSPNKTVSLAKRLRWRVFYWGRDLLWRVGRWNSCELKDFIISFNPDIIFQPIYDRPFMTRISLFIKELTKKPMLGYITDDIYTLKQINFSPLYWIDRLYYRKRVKELINKCEILYVISEFQKEEYEKIFTPRCKILTKSACFSNKGSTYDSSHDIIRINYAGGLGNNRFKSIGLISKAVERLKNEGYLVEFDIYTSTAISKRMRHKICKKGTNVHTAIPYKAVLAIQKESDILVHAESLNLKNRLEVHQSFSTKLVDYFMLGKCILAIGSSDTASIYHLKKNDAAVVVEDKSQVYNSLKKLITQPSIIFTYGEKAYQCGKKYHNSEYMKQMLLADIISICQGEK